MMNIFIAKILMHLHLFTEGYIVMNAVGNKAFIVHALVHH